MSDDVVRFGAGGISYKSAEPAPEVSKKPKKKKPEVVVELVDVVETQAQDLSELGIKK